MTTTKITATRVAVVRAAADIAPKLVAAGAGGLSATTLVAILASFGIDVPASLAALITAVVALVCGYIKHDTPILTDLQAAADALKDEDGIPAVEGGLEFIESQLEAHRPTLAPGESRPVE